MTGRRRYRRQRGAVLVVVMVVMVMIGLIATTLVENFTTSEAREVEASLMESRVKWAMLGHLNYIRARARTQGLCAALAKNTTLVANQLTYCGGADFNSAASVLSTTRAGLTTVSMVGSMQDYLDNADELQNGSIVTPGTMRWRYPTGTDPRAVVAGSDRNFVDIRGLVRPRDNDALNANIVNDGLMTIELEVVASDTQTPVFAGIRERFQRLSIGFCVVDQQTAVTAGILPLAGCGAAEGESRIQFVRRDALLP
jgi:type II secretory pathway pseudopilin PulG